MAIIPKVSKDQVGLYARLQRLEEILDYGALVRKIAVSELLDDYMRRAGIPEECPRALFRFGLSLALRSEYYPPHGESGSFPGKLPNRGATTNLDVIGIASLHSQ